MWWLNGYTNQGLDPNGVAKAAALATAKANGYQNGAGGVTVTVNIPPLSGPFKGKPTHTEVIISAPQKRYFSKVFGSTSITYGARAVSRGRRGGINNAIICLDPTGKGALNAGGNGSVTVSGSPIQVNSNNTEAMIANGNGFMIADKFLVTGAPGYTTPGGGSFSGPIVPNSEPIPDPLANLPVPDPSTMIVQATKQVQVQGNKTENLQPGVYKGGISATGCSLNLAPGFYVMDLCGFNTRGQDLITRVGVLIFTAPQSTSDKIDISGQGSIILSPMLTGPYQGILLFQDRTSTAPVNISGSSGVTMNITGTFYAASATLNVTGNGAQQTIGSQYISYDLVLGGNGTYYCTWTPDLTPGTREILLVE
jgi:hypothetical protein